ncbi:MAG: sel1 repeat family protein [Chlorobium sp.]|nr:MAG: sel1 repeat family protein [Chlorobium sp.]
MLQKSLFALVSLMLFCGTAYPDSREKLQVIQLEAEKGNAQAQNKLGVFYEIGLNVNKDDVEAVRWYRLAAEQEYAEAQFNLGEMYEEGLGVTKDEAIAKAWYEKACKNGWECGCKKYRHLSENGCE